MKRVLVIAYHFPPVGGAGVQRSLKFVEHLPSFGFEPVVVTGPGRQRERWTPADESLIASLPRGLEVHRISEPEPGCARGWRRRSERWLRVPSRFAAWWTHGVTELALKIDDIDLVYVSMSPFESSDAAAAVARRLERPLVADLRDPWALDEMQIYPSRLHRLLEERMMGHALSQADAIVMNTREATAALLRRFPRLAEKQVVTITNGFDRTDFEREPSRRIDDAFRIVHTGYLHTELGRLQRRRSRVRKLIGGELGDVDILARSHVNLVEALRRLICRRPALAQRLELHLAGVVSDLDRSLVARDPWIIVHGYLAHAESVDLVRSADLLFLPMHDLPLGTRSRIVPGKTYEYLASGRPVLAAVPDGDARDMLAARASSLLARPNDVAEIERLVEQALEEYVEHGRAPSEPMLPDLASLERRALTEELANVFREALPNLQPEPAGGHNLRVHPEPGR